MRLSNPIVTFPTIAALHVYSIWAVAAGDILSTLFGTKWSCQLLWLGRESLSPNCLSLWRAIFCQGWREYLALPRHLCSGVALHCCEGSMSTLGMWVSRAVVSAHCNKWFKAVKSKWFVDTVVVV
jgi:hypothetical protein